MRRLFGSSIIVLLVAMGLLLARSPKKSETVVDEGQQPNWATRGPRTEARRDRVGPDRDRIRRASSGWPSSDLRSQISHQGGSAAVPRDRSAWFALDPRDGPRGGDPLLGEIIKGGDPTADKIGQTIRHRRWRNYAGNTSPMSKLVGC